MFTLMIILITVAIVALTAFAVLGAVLLLIPVWLDIAVAVLAIGLCVRLVKLFQGNKKS